MRCQLIHTSLEALLALSVNDVFTENALISLNLRGRLLFRSSDAQSIISTGAAVSIGALRRRCFSPSLLLGETPTGPDHSAMVAVKCTLSILALMLCWSGNLEGLMMYDWRHQRLKEASHSNEIRLMAILQAVLQLTANEAPQLGPQQLRPHLFCHRHTGLPQALPTVRAMCTGHCHACEQRSSASPQQPEAAPGDNALDTRGPKAPK